MTDYDVIIIGAGSAGTAAAYDLAMSNISVLLLDKSRFPRRKACAGGLTVKAASALRFSVAPVVKNTCRQMAISNNLKKPAVLNSPQPLVLMTDRSELDVLCLDKALRAGASFYQGTIESVQAHENVVAIQTGQDHFRTKFLVGADGANSFIRRHCGLFAKFRRGFAIETTIPTPAPGRYPMTFDFGIVSSGYGWIFPKDDHLNLGLYTYNDKIKIKAANLYNYCHKKIGNRSLHHMAAHYIGLGGWEYIPKAGRIFLVGDAAGLADPILGEGLHNAIKSGQAVAGAIIKEITGGKSAAAEYHQSILPIKADVLAGYKAAKWFYRFPTLGVALLTTPVIGNRLIKGYAAGLTFNEIKTSFGHPFNFPLSNR